MARKKSLHPFLISTLPLGVAGYIRLVQRTTRWKMVNDKAYRRIISSDSPFICAFWHSRLLMLPILKKMQGRDLSALISDHRDGEIMARVANHFDVHTRRGSTANHRKKEKNKGGAAALRALIRDIKNGRNIGITPDGPRGPRQRAHGGVIQLARLSGRPILPMTYSIEHGRQLNSWDRFLLPYPVPLSKGAIVFGEPIYITEKGDEAVEQARQAVEDALNHITKQADEMTGRSHIDPAPISTLDAS